AGWTSFLYLGPALGLTLAAKALCLSPRTRTWLHRHAPTVFDGMFLLAIVGLSLMWMRIIAEGRRPEGNPVQFTLAVVSMFAYRSRYWHLLARNILYASTMALIFFLMSPSFFMESQGYFIGGMGIGSWLAFMGHVRQRIRF